MNGSCKGVSSFVRKSIVLACPIGFEKGSQSKAGAAAVDVPTVSYDYVGCPAGHRVDFTFVPRGDFTSWDAAVALSVYTGACLG